MKVKDTEERRIMLGVAVLWMSLAVWVSGYTIYWLWKFWGSEG